MTAPAKKRRRAEAVPGGSVRLPDGTTWPSLERAGALEWTMRYGAPADMMKDRFAVASVLSIYTGIADLAPDRIGPRLRYVLRHLRAFDRRTRRGE